MKVIIFGAAGGIGKHAVSHALNKGYEVIGYMRNPDKLQINHEKLTKMKGQIDNYEEMKSAMNGVDAVVWWRRSKWRWQRTCRSSAYVKSNEGTWHQASD